MERKQPVYMEKHSRTSKLLCKSVPEAARHRGETILAARRTAPAQQAQRAAHEEKKRLHRLGTIV